MTKNNCLLCILLLVCAQLMSCGYTFVGASPISLPQDRHYMNISLVQNPTQEAWLESYLRSKLRDEFTRRGGAVWVSPEQAQALVHIEVSQFRTADGLTRQKDQTVKADVNITMEVKILSADTGEQIWSSGSINGRSSYFLAAQSAVLPGSSSPEQRGASEDAVDQAVTRVADRLGDGF
jgi:outer membrane lipopolysaccharide assembly protein LptE/RlpB